MTTNKQKQARAGAYTAAHRTGRLRSGRLRVGTRIESKLAAEEARQNAEELREARLGAEVAETPQDASKRRIQPGDRVRCTFVGTVAFIRDDQVCVSPDVVEPGSDGLYVPNADTTLLLETPSRD